MFKTKEINQIQIKPVINNNNNTKNNVRAYKYYSQPYANICLMARKNSGKSTVIYRALEECSTKGTNVFIFSPTVNMDPTYAKMIKMLKKKGCNVVANEHFIDPNGVDLIEQIIHILSKKDEEEENQDVYKPPPLLYFGHDKNYKAVDTQVGGGCTLVERPQPKKPKKEPKKGKGKKLLTPESIFVFDDLSSEMRHKSIAKLLTKNRHYKLKTFLSCHSVNNLEKGSLSCIDTFHVFPNISNEKIEELGEKVNITFKNDTKKNPKLQQLYDYATATPYSFLYIDRTNDTFRKNFSDKILIESE